METINYQGREIEVTLVNHMSGHLIITMHTDTWWMAHEGDEELFRDADGQYYLRRKLCLWDKECDEERFASGRTHVHKLSVKAAAYWATMRSMAFTNDLRRDLRKSLTENVFDSGDLNTPMLPPVTLEPKADALVRRYLETTPFAYTVADIISGSVTYALGTAFDSLPEAKKGGTVDGEHFHDGGWGYVEEDIFNAQHRRLGLPQSRGREYNAELDARVVKRMQPVSKGEPHPTALHGLNAAKPEPVSAREIVAAQAVREGRPTALRDGLLHLAADWRDEGARTGGRIATVLTRCADALEAAVEGKEGR